MGDPLTNPQGGGDLTDRFEFVLVNEDGVEYARHTTWDEARDTLAEFPNDQIVVRVKAPTYHDTDVYGHCDTCGAPCDHKGCTANRAHAAAISDSVFSRTVLILSYAPQGEDGGAAGFFWEPPESLVAVTHELERVIGEGGYQVSLFTAKVPADLTPEQTTYWIELNMKELLL